MKTLEEYSTICEKEDIKNKFLDIFSSLEHQYKQAIHLCQFKSYKSNSDLSKAEFEAQECIKPYLIMRRHLSAELMEAEFKFDDCIKEANKEYKSDKRDLTIKLTRCLLMYKKNLPLKKEKIDRLYKGYLLNYKDSIEI